MTPLSFLVPLFHLHLASSTKAEVRSGASHGLIHPSSIEFNFTTRKILANESRYRIIHSLDRLVNVRKSVETCF